MLPKIILPPAAGLSMIYAPSRLSNLGQHRRLRINRPHLSPLSKLEIRNRYRVILGEETEKC